MRVTRRCVGEPGTVPLAGAGVRRLPADRSQSPTALFSATGILRVAWRERDNERRSHGLETWPRSRSWPDFPSRADLIAENADGRSRPMSPISASPTEDGTASRQATCAAVARRNTSKRSRRPRYSRSWRAGSKKRVPTIRKRALFAQRATTNNDAMIGITKYHERVCARNRPYRCGTCPRGTGCLSSRPRARGGPCIGLARRVRPAPRPAGSPGLGRHAFRDLFAHRRESLCRFLQRRELLRVRETHEVGSVVRVLEETRARHTGHLDLLG